jgi:pyruvate formate lyase activating enzyme
MKEASFYEKKPDGKVHCYLCRHHCHISAGKRGICGVRENREGTLYTLVYELPCATHADPIEKKPLFHFFPGSKAFSIATAGCNFHCLHCQNHDISQVAGSSCAMDDFGRERVTAEDVVAAAKRAQCKSISYTYTEPTVFFEYAFDIAKQAKAEGLYNNFVTNGYIENEPLTAIRPYLDAANIDLKGFDEQFYKKVCKADLSKVLDTIRAYRKLNIWIELTTLIIPGHNDEEESLRAIAKFIIEELGVHVPWHVSAFYPTYKLLDAPPTDPETLTRAREIGLEEGLRYVYEGNVPGTDGEHTYCWQCGKIVIKRRGYSILEYGIDGGVCSFCGAVIDGFGL